MKSFLRYVLVGGAGTAIDVLVLYVLAIKLGYPLYISTSIAFIFAATHNFILNKIWTFDDRGGKYKRQYLKFLMVSVIGLGITLCCMGLLVQVLKTPIIIAKLLTSGIVLSWNFLANKHWTFATRFYLEYQKSSREYPLFLTIIIPAFNEERRIQKTLTSLEAWRAEQEKPESIEILVVDDGSMDHTGEIVRSCFPGVRLVGLPKNTGKGRAVAEGAFCALGKYSLMFDADGSTPIEEISKLLPHIQSHQYVIGSRYQEQGRVLQKQNYLRRFIGRLGNILIQAILIDGIHDTQCGFKLFHTDAGAAVFNKQKIHRWGFDIEMLFLARAFGFQILEIGVDWHNDDDSRFRAIRDSGRTFYELLSIKFFAWFGGYK